MTKKDYRVPSLEVMEIETASIICATTEEVSKVQTGDESMNMNYCGPGEVGARSRGIDVWENSDNGNDAW